MKKAIVILTVGLSLVFMLGSIGPKPYIPDPNSKPDAHPCSASRERILKYEIVVACDPNKLVEKVTNKLKETGHYQFVGGISVENNRYYQAMVMVTD